jgi:PAS domain S-box-containing protein
MTTEPALNAFDDFVQRMKIILRAIDQSSDGIAIADTSGIILHVNRTFAEMHGAACEELIGKHLSHFNSMEESKEYLSVKEQLEETGQFRGEVQHKKLDGTVFPVLERSLLVRDEKGNRIGTVVTAGEIREIDRLREELKESEEKYLNLAQNSIDGIVILEGIEIKYVNQACLHMFGYQNEAEVIGLTMTSFISPDYRELMVQRAKDRDSGMDVPGIYDFKALRKDGTEFPALVSVSSIHYKGKTARQGVIRDMTKQKEMEEELLRSHESFNALLENTEDGIFLADRDFHFIAFNSYFATHYKKNRGVEPRIGAKFAFETFKKEKERSFLKKAYVKALRGEKVKDVFSLTTKKGVQTYRELWIHPIRENGKIKGFTETSRDVTERVFMQEALEKAHDDLEMKVEDRTSQLKKTNEELEAKTYELEQLNTALNVLLKKKDEDKLQIENTIVANFQELVEPYMEKLDQTELTKKQRAFLEIIQANQKDIVGPFLANVTEHYLKFGPSEIRVANLVRHGKTTKEIAEILSLSPSTVRFHRENIREKLGIRNKKANLRSHLIVLHQRITS